MWPHFSDLAKTGGLLDDTSSDGTATTDQQESDLGGFLEWREGCDNDFFQVQHTNMVSFVTALVPAY